MSETQLFQEKRLLQLWVSYSSNLVCEPSQEEDFFKKLRKTEIKTLFHFLIPQSGSYRSILPSLGGGFYTVCYSYCIKGLFIKHGLSFSGGFYRCRGCGTEGLTETIILRPQLDSRYCHFFPLLSLTYVFNIIHPHVTSVTHLSHPSRYFVYVFL